VTIGGPPFDPETLAMLKAVFEEACGVLPPDPRTSRLRSDLAILILRRAAEGGISSAELRRYALSEAAALGSRGPASKEEK
jgi:hypothetical protein